MAEQSRIDDLRRRVQKDPASIAFAQLAEECRRAGAYEEAVDTCRAGLAIHPGYLSARVTLGRALIELNQLDEAQTELSRVLESAAENLAAIRGLAEIHHRRGDLALALTQYRAALLLARNDPDLEETIADLTRMVEPARPAPAGGLTLQHMQEELLKLAPEPKAEPDYPPEPPQTSEQPSPTSDRMFRVSAAMAAESGSNPNPAFGIGLQADDPAGGAFDHVNEFPSEAGSREADAFAADAVFRALDVPAAHSAVDELPPPDGTLTASADDRAIRIVAALEQWLAAIHVSREHRHA